MKGIFKKNQVIITSLALMLAVAGYLQMSGDAAKKKPGDGDAAQTSNTVGNHYEITAGDLTDYYGDISDEDMLGQSMAAAENENAQAVSADGTGTTDAADAAKMAEDPGEAVLVSTTIRGDYAVNAKLNREQTRAKNGNSYGYVGRRIFVRNPKAGGNRRASRDDGDFRKRTGCRALTGGKRLYGCSCQHCGRRSGCGD